MRRNQQNDLHLLQSFLNDLREFKRLKLEKWEKIDNQVQASSHPGSPSEDWIIPPDEHKALHLLEQDLDYNGLKDRITLQIEEVKKTALFLNGTEKHALDWVCFNSPLIGNAALDEALEALESLIVKCQHSSYFKKNLLTLLGWC